VFCHVLRDGAACTAGKVQHSVPFGEVGNKSIVPALVVPDVIPGAVLTIAIARGQGLKASAVKMGLAVTTARSQLQQAFAKTGTKHQAELAALVRTLTQIRQP
jgi:hypothetical protein